MPRSRRTAFVLRALAPATFIAAVGGAVAVALHDGGTYEAAYKPPSTEVSKFVGARAAPWSPAGPKPAPKPASSADDDTVPLDRSVSCSDIDGVVLAETARWRVVHADTGNYDGTTPVVACRPHQRGPAPVRLLAMARWAPESEDDPAPSPEGGPYIDGVEISGDRLLLTTGFYDVTFPPGGGVASSLQVDTNRLIDLQRGASAPLPGRSEFDNYSPDETTRHAEQTTMLTADGAVATVWASGSVGRSHRRTLQPLTIWDARGPRTLAGRYDTLALSGRHGTRRGLYLRRTDGHVSFLGLTGPAQMDAVAPDPELAWRTMALPEITSAERADQDSDDGNLQQLGTDGPWLRWTGHGNHDPKARILISIDSPDDRRVGELAPHSYSQFKVLDDGLQTAMVVGRFTTDPGELRLRLIGKYRPADAFFDRPATPAMAKPGNAVTVDSNYGGKGTFVVFDGTSLLFWGPHGGATHYAPGLHALTAAVPVGDAHLPLGVFATTANGQPRLYTR